MWLDFSAGARHCSGLLALGVVPAAHMGHVASHIALILRHAVHLVLHRMAASCTHNESPWQLFEAEQVCTNSTSCSCFSSADRGHEVQVQRIKLHVSFWKAAGYMHQALWLYRLMTAAVAFEAAAVGFAQ